MYIRKVEIDDAKKYLVMLKNLDKQTKFMAYEENERKATIEEQEGIIKRNQDSGNPMFLAEVNGEIVGFAAGRRGGLNRMKHNLYIALGILKDYRGLGIGRAFLEKLDEWSIKNGVEKIELTVICKNNKALGLYKKMGYEIEGTKRAGIKIDGVLEDEYYMGKLL